ncbi:restriction endonuclease [Pseudanabaena yagii]|uniref:Restriction endonuclease n=1 Tax=Pseudanabaena yagii GIHE-NHR1 TaxID=2722753 RepID=A0ABX1LN61_9CYAN|nr:restriction endonuclease [Pseudanabaena yagii]NMF56501.1 restriction endonuclease [Pseudanabaena yagii GIHE-NHR1]
MVVPTYQDFLLPLLKVASDDQEHLLSQTIELLANQFNLNEEDRKELLPSGRQTKLANRIGWAITYLKKAKLLESGKRGTFYISLRGKEVLESQPSSIDRSFLERFTEFKEFQNIRSSDDLKIDISIVEDIDQTPEENFEISYQKLKKELGEKLLEQIKNCSPKFFEKLVVDLLLAMGYGGSRKDAGEAVGKSGDGGIDGIIKEDNLGLDLIYIQAKRWEASVGRPAVQAFAGSLEGMKARKGVMITTSQFTKEAKEYVKIIEKRIILIDGDKLTQLMIDFGVGVSEIQTYILQKVDSDYFDEDI